jgi:hypothetical protein
MTKLNYLTEVPPSCDLEDPNFMAFVEVTSLIRGHNVVEEFLPCGLWPLGEQFCFRVQMKESPLSKVMVSKPQITAAIGERESEAKFVARIKKSMNLLDGKYNIAEHKANHGLRHGRLNHIFGLVGVLCQPRPEPIVWKHKSAITGIAAAPRKIASKRGRGRRSSHSGTETSAQELALAKPLKCSMKFAVKSSGLSSAEKASVTGVGATGKKMCPTSTGGSGATRAPKRALNQFDSGSLVFPRNFPFQRCTKIIGGERYF